MMRNKLWRSSFCLLLTLFSHQLYSACSSYKGFATINEASALGFVEVKLLDLSIPASEYQSWQIKMCREKTNGTQYTCDSTRTLAGITPLNSAFLILPTSFLIQNQYFDILLEDASGNTIDYLRINGISPVQLSPPAGCQPAFDWDAEFITSFDYRREPDGTGDWQRESGNSGGETEGGTNDVNLPIISVTDITVNKGTNATFTLSIPAAVTEDIEVLFNTLDSSAVAGIHYTVSTGSITIPSGSTSATLDVLTTANSPDGTVFFYLFLSDPENGTLANHYPIATLIDVPSLDHIEITHDGSALTCSPETLTIKACLDAACTSVSNIDVDVSLSTSGGLSSWSQNPITIPANSLSGITVELTHRTAESIVLSAASTATNPLVCNPIGCALEFFQAGFILNLTNHQSCSVQNMTLQAVKISDTGTSCAPAYTGNQSVDFIYQYLNPTTGTIIPQLAGSNLAATESLTQNRTVNFDANASASLSFEYRDAGQISLTANDPGGFGLSSATSTIVVTPAQLIVSATDAASNCPSNDASCSSFVAAGSPFNIEVKASCADPTIITPNFETSNGVTLTVNTIAPALGNPVSLGINSINFSDADNGIHSEANQSISEVGVFTLSATANNYFGSNLPSGTSESIGRFYPDHFDISAPIIAEQCGTFTYAGFSDGVNLGLDKNGQAFEIAGTITAENIFNDTTLNYVGSFAKLTTSNISVQSFNVTDSVNATGTLNNTFAALNFLNGSSTYTDTNAHYQHDTLSAPFNLRLDLSATDSDGVSSNSVSSNDFELRIGRLRLIDSYGPEIADLEMRVFSDYFDGTSWQLNSADNCSTFIDSNVSLDLASYTDQLNDGETNIFAPLTIQTLSAGVSSSSNGLWFSAPGDNNYGSVLIIHDLSTQDWLKFDWDLDNNLDNANARLNFGYYRGSDRVIYWREVRN